jgi:lipoprotein-anchoring transpeptidase ErfK/SrfK
LLQSIGPMTQPELFSKRHLIQLGVGGLVLVGLGGCQQAGRSVTSAIERLAAPFRGDVFDADAHYAARSDAGYDIPAIPLREIETVYLRQRVPFEGTERAGTIVVDPYDRFLYFVEKDGTAVRYGVGVGREGFGWSGFARVGRKALWPTWTPPAEMIARQPELEEFRNGMPPGIDNPLGARALYLYQGSRDTLYRLHGTNEPFSIGKAVSSGCVRLFNQDIIDLHTRAKTGSDVVVLGTA